MARVGDPGNATTAQVADAVVRLGLPLRVSPAGLRAVRPGDLCAGRVLPVQHYGSVDIFLEAFEAATGGEVLVIDNQGRTDEGCIGDLTVIEGQAAGLAGIIVWGAHRDTAELRQLDLPVFSFGTHPAGPVRLDSSDEAALVSAQFGDFHVTDDDFVFADADGAIFVPISDLDDVVAVAASIRDKETAQADLVRGGRTLREQFRFAEYLELRAVDPGYTFREHLRSIGGAIEE